MPLHRERERRRVAHAKGFDHAVRRARLDLEIVAQRLHALRVQRIHLQALVARELAQLPAGRERHFVGRAVLLIERRLHVFLVVIR